MYSARNTEEIRETPIRRFPSPTLIIGIKDAAVLLGGKIYLQSKKKNFLYIFLQFWGLTEFLGKKTRLIGVIIEKVKRID